MKMKDRFLAFFDPLRSVILYIIGTAAFTLVLQAIYDLANQPNQFQGGYWLAIAMLFVVILILLISRMQRGGMGRVSIREEFKPNKRKGLVLLLGPTEASAPASIEYHLPTLQCCWMIATKESIKTAVILAEKYAGQIPNLYWGSPNYLVDPDQIQSTYDMIVRILDVEAIEAGLKRSDIISDITGGVKPMTAGMSLACLARNYDMQYMKAPRDALGQVVKGGIPEPIHIDTTLVPSASLPIS